MAVEYSVSHDSKASMSDSYFRIVAAVLSVALIGGVTVICG